jgi:serine/threonine protein kinase
MESTAPLCHGEQRVSCSPIAQSREQDPFGLLGTVVEGRYLVERVVGRGGFGVVYRARHLRLDAPIALKVLHLAESLTGERRRQVVSQFLSEGKLAFGLGGAHPAIARVFEAGTASAANSMTLPYLAMEWLDGVSLGDFLRTQRDTGSPPLSLHEMIELLTPIAEALASAHERRISHRDIKPANIFLVQHGWKRSAKLLDFGLAKMAGDGGTSSERVSVSGERSPSGFTPAYAAPEQWLCRLGPIGPWTDVYALALVAVEVLSGRFPMSGEGWQQLMAGSLDESARPTPRALGVSCSDAVEAVFARALSVVPNQRQRDMLRFWADLKEASCGEPSSAVWPLRGFAERAAERGPTFALADEQPDPPRPAVVGRLGKRRYLGVSVAGLTLLFAGVAWRASAFAQPPIRSPLPSLAASTSAARSAHSAPPPIAVDIATRVPEIDARAPAPSRDRVHAKLAPVWRPRSTPLARKALAQATQASVVPAPPSTAITPDSLLDSDAFVRRK